MSLNKNEQSKIGKLIDGKHPIYGSKQIGEIKGKNNTLKLYDYPLNIEYTSTEESISILFVGQSGAGKTTFINAYVNHLLGITINHDIRYKLIDKSKEKDQTTSQTDTIKIYNVRSLKYNNKLFKLIDTPGAGDTRNDNKNKNSSTEKDQKEKEFLAMYDKFTNEIGQLNSITIVIKENEFQKKLIKNIINIINLFPGDIDKNFLAVLTHADIDTEEDTPDAVQLLEKMDIFKKKSDNNENDWYFPVSSKSYFIPFLKGRKNSISEAQFKLTEESFEKYTNKLLSLKLYHTKNKHLELKEQEKIIKRLLHDVIDNIFYTIIKLEDIKVILAQKSKIYDDMQKEIEIIKMSIKYENDLRKEIEKIYNIYITYKLEKEKEIKENNEKVKQLSDKNNSIVYEIKSLLNIKVKTEEEKLKEYKIKELKNKSKYLEKEISQIKAEIDNKIKKK